MPTRLLRIVPYLDLNATITENEKVIIKLNICSFAIAVMLQYYLANWFGATSLMLVVQ